MPSTPVNIVNRTCAKQRSNEIFKFDGKLVCFVTVKPFAFNYYLDISIFFMKDIALK